MTDWRHDRIGSALRGENPSVLARLPAGFATMGDVQWLPGYCVLLADDPSATMFSQLPRAKRLQFLTDLDTVATAVERACRRADPDFNRLNLEILGNGDAFVHAHVWPRYTWEPPERRTAPVWLYPRQHWTDPDHALGPRHDTLRASITEELAAGKRQV